jgi:hypothetical protein
MLIEVLTRVYKRPAMLAVNQASLDAQTDSDWVQTLLVDDVGRGVAWANRSMSQYGPNLEGDYVWILDDDDKCIRPTFFADLRGIIEAHNPDVIFVKMDHKERGILPGKSWGCEPKHSDIGCSAFVVKREIWQQYAENWNASYAGDFNFINAVFLSNPKVYWFDVIASQVQRISMGKPE